MSDNKQSSVEWLYDNLSECFDKFDNGNSSYTDFVNESKEVIEQAKAMHKEEHSNTWDESLDNYKKGGENDMRHWVDFDYYYNETFGGNNDKEQNS